MFDLVKDDSFEIQNTKDYILSIQVSLDGFSFLIVHPDKKRIVAYKNLLLKISSNELLTRHLKEWLDSEDILKNQFKSVRSLIFTENFTLIPDEYSGREWHRNLTSALFDKKIHNNFIENDINDLDTTLIFPVARDIVSVLHQYFNKNIEILHPVTNILNTFFKSKKRNQAIIISTKKYFYLIINRNHKLLFANSFSILHQNDLVYNVLNSFQQLEISRSETNMFFAGSINQNKEIAIILQPFFENIGNIITEEVITNSEIIDNYTPLYLTLK